MFMQFDLISAEQSVCDDSERQTHEARTFDVPPSIWRVMVTSYAIFFAAITLATGHDGATIFMIVISALYAAMYFGTAMVMNRVDRANRQPHRGGMIQTLTGPLSYGAAFAQMLTVPILLAFFAIAIVIIVAATPI